MNHIFEVGEIICNIDTIARVTSRESSWISNGYDIEFLLSEPGTFCSNHTRGRYVISTENSLIKRELCFMNEGPMAVDSDLSEEEIFCSFDQMTLEEKLCHGNESVRCIAIFEHNPVSMATQIRQMLEQLIRRENADLHPGPSNIST